MTRTCFPDGITAYHMTKEGRKCFIRRGKTILSQTHIPVSFVYLHLKKSIFVNVFILPGYQSGKLHTQFVRPTCLCLAHHVKIEMVAHSSAIQWIMCGFCPNHPLTVLSVWAQLSK